MLEMWKTGAGVMDKIKSVPHEKLAFLMSPRCGARRKYDGLPCQCPAMPNGRCRLHGGKSTGPKTPEGKEKAAKANFKHGRYTKENLIRNREIQALLRRYSEMIRQQEFK